MSGDTFNINTLDFGEDLKDLQDEFGLMNPEEEGDDCDSKNMIDQDLNVVIDYLLELQRLDNTSSNVISQVDTLAVDNAIRVNDQMQNEVKKQIREIDRKMEENTKLLARIRSAALAEYRAARKVKIHFKYDNNINYFPAETASHSRNTTNRQRGSNDEVLSEGEIYTEEEDDEYEEEEEEDEEDDHREEGAESDDEYEDFLDDNTTEKTRPPNKAWSVAERRRLAQGIHAAAQRGYVLDLKEKSEEWKVWEVDKIPREELERYRVDRINWQRISSDYVKTRSWIECIIQWTTQEHPDINKKPWGKAEAEKLATIVEEKGPGKWEEIANTLGTNRTVSQCFSHYMAYENNLKTKGRFSKEEDIRLMSAVKLLGDWNWQQIATVMENRTGQQCLHRWTKSLDPSIKRESWCKEEDKVLKNTVNLYGAGNWRKIQRFLPGRTDVQCRERWMNILHPALNKTKLTKEELEQVISLVEEHGPKWSYIATFFPGRTDNLIMKEYKQFTKTPIPLSERKKRGRPRTGRPRAGRPRAGRPRAGRPRAEKNIVDINSIEESSKTNETTASDRPEIISIEETSDEQENSDVEIDIVEVVEPVVANKAQSQKRAIEDQAENNAKRRRGRPSKKTSVEVENSNTEIDIVEVVEPVEKNKPQPRKRAAKKHRGRPRKNI